jgi:N utilization substance protein A
MDLDLRRVIDQVSKDKGVARETVIETLEKALVTAARRKFGQEREIEAQFNQDTGEIELFEFKSVVETVSDPHAEISLGEARELDPEVELDDQVGVKLDTSGFGRIAAQTAKQVIIQEVRGAERQIIYDEYKDRKGEIVNGIVRRIEKGNLIVDLGRAEAIVPRKEQVPREMFRVNERIRAYVLDVLKESRGPQIVLSRACTEFLTKLFEQEVPEIYEGIVRIEAAAREPGARAKIAVASRDSDVDPVGACVGMRGSRVQAVVQELRGEKIDIVPWSADSVRYVCAALAPAQPLRVMVDDVNQSMDVIVPDDQLSLAIGTRGQNVRLAVQLARWKIDIKSESRMQEVQEELAQALSVVSGAGEYEAKLLLDHGVASLEELAQAQEGARAVRERAAELHRDKLERQRVEAEQAAAAEAETATAAAGGPSTTGETPAAEPPKREETPAGS